MPSALRDAAGKGLATVEIMPSEPQKPEMFMIFRHKFIVYITKY